MDSEWKDIEIAPKDGSVIVVSTKRRDVGRTFDLVFWDKERGRWGNNVYPSDWLCGCDLWMPLPEVSE